ncbi:MAG: hypothetical protein RLZZ59_735 [Pseudomonadota bacterium]|jgi:SPP1 family predicted phage head-tail adaptor
MISYPLTKILSHKVIFLKNISNNDLEEQNWQEAYSTFADIRPMYDNRFQVIETQSFGHIVTEAFYIFRIRFSEIINTKMRIMFKRRLFEIKRIINEGERSLVLRIIALEL